MPLGRKLSAPGRRPSSGAPAWRAHRSRPPDGPVDRLGEHRAGRRAQRRAGRGRLDVADHARADRRARVVAVAHRTLIASGWRGSSSRATRRSGGRPARYARVIRTGALEVVEDLSPEAIQARRRGRWAPSLLENLNVRHYVDRATADARWGDRRADVRAGRLRAAVRAHDLELITTWRRGPRCTSRTRRLYTERRGSPTRCRLGCAPARSRVSRASSSPRGSARRRPARGRG